MRYIYLTYKFFPVAILSAVLYCGDALAADNPEPVEVRGTLLNRGESFFKTGEKIEIRLQAVFNDPGVKAKSMDCELFINGMTVEKRTVHSGECCDFSTSLDKPGWVAAFGTLCGEDGKPLLRKNPPNQWDKIVKGGIGAMVEPESIKSAVPEPADFDKFWRLQRAELDKIPLNPQLVEVESAKQDNGLVRCYDVTIDCLGGSPVRGYLSIPVDAKPKSLPAIVYFDGAGVRSAGKPYRVKNAIAFNPNPHGIENGKPKEFYTGLEKGALAGYAYKGEKNRDTYYFNGMLLRAMRALDYVKSLPEWDGSILISCGRSMGSGQAIAATALDPQVTLCIAACPALGDLTGGLDGRLAAYPKPITIKNGSSDSKNIVGTVVYFDSANFAKRINCEIYLSTGFIDFVCPPTSAYLIYNSLPPKTKKDIKTYPTMGHIHTCLTGGDDILRNFERTGRRLPSE